MTAQAMVAAVRTAPGPGEIYCEYYGCRILARMCVARQRAGKAQWGGGIIRRIPYDQYCASGKCAQGAGVAEAVEKGAVEMARKKTAPAAHDGERQCNVCNAWLPETEEYFRKSEAVGRLVKTCWECEQKHYGERFASVPKPKAAAQEESSSSTPKPTSITIQEALKRLDPAELSSSTPTPTEEPLLPPGFEPVPADDGRLGHGMFVSFRDGGIRFSRALLADRGYPERVQLYWNRQTRQVGLLFGRGGSKITRESGSGKISSAPAMRAMGIGPQNKVPVEVLPSGVVVTREGAL